MPEKIQDNKENTINNRTVGTKYEDMATAYLVNQGYRIIERNYKNAFGEIDIILEKDETLIFAEVKFRSSNKYGSPLEAVDYRKQKRICKAALYYYTRHGYAESRACRFDVIGISGDGTICHIKNAFEFQE